MDQCPISWSRLGIILSEHLQHGRCLPSMKTRCGPELLKGPITAHNPSRRNRRTDGATENHVLLTSHKSFYWSLGSGLTQPNTGAGRTALCVCVYPRKAWVSYYITNAWILMTALLKALLSSLLSLTHIQICTVSSTTTPTQTVNTKWCCSMAGHVHLSVIFLKHSKAVFSNYLMCVWLNTQHIFDSMMKY